MGDEPGDGQEVTILNRKLTWKNGKITYEADDKHAKLIIEEMGVAGDSKGLEAACVRETGEDAENLKEEEPVGRAEARRYREIAARANYLAQDRADIQFVAKEICRCMSAPRPGSWKKLKRLARYFVQYPCLMWESRAVDSGEDDVIDIYTDSDWAG